MAIAFTSRGIADGNGADNVGASATFVSNQTWTPAADSLLLAFVGTQSTSLANSNGIASISGHGTWTLFGTDVYLSGSTQRLQLWWCKVGSSPSSSALTFTNTAQFKLRRQVAIVEITGHDPSAAIGDILRQVVANEIDGLSGDVTLSSFLNGDSATLLGITTTRFAEDVVWDSPLTELSQAPTGTEQMRVGAAYYVGEDLSPGYSFGANSRISGVLGIEVVAAATGVDLAIPTGTSVEVTAQPLALEPAGFADIPLIAGDIDVTAQALAIEPAGAATLDLASATIEVTGAVLDLATGAGELALPTAWIDATAQPLDLAPAGAADLALAPPTIEATAQPLAIEPAGAASLELATATIEITVPPLNLQTGAGEVAIPPGTSIQVTAAVLELATGAGNLALAAANTEVTAQPLTLTPAGAAALEIPAGTTVETTGHPLTLASDVDLSLEPATIQVNVSPVELAPSGNTDVTLTTAVAQATASTIDLVADGASTLVLPAVSIEITAVPLGVARASDVTYRLEAVGVAGGRLEALNPLSTRLED